VKFVRTIVTQLFHWPLLIRELRRADVVHVFSAAARASRVARRASRVAKRTEGVHRVVNRLTIGPKHKD